MLWLKGYCLALCFCSTAHQCQGSGVCVSFSTGDGNCRSAPSVFLSFSPHTTIVCVNAASFCQALQNEIHSAVSGYWSPLPCCCKDNQRFKSPGSTYRKYFLPAKSCQWPLPQTISFLHSKFSDFSSTHSPHPWCWKAKQKKHPAVLWDLPCSRLASSRVKSTLANLLWQ